jgi:hypothetical protein
MVAEEAHRAGGVTVTGIVNFWLVDLTALDTPDARQKAMKGTVDDWGRPRARWPQGKPTRSPSQANGSNPDRSSAIPTSKRTCRRCGDGSIRRVCGWHGC